MRTLLKKKPAKAPARAKKKKSAVKKEGQEKFSLKRLLMGEEKPNLTELESGSTISVCRYPPFQIRFMQFLILLI